MKIKRLLLKITNLLPILFIGIIYGQSVKIENLDKIEIRENSTINVQFNVTVGSGHDGHVSIFTTSFDSAPPTFVEQGSFVFGANNGGFDSTQSFNIRLNANSFEATGGKLYAEFERNSGIKRRSNVIPIKVIDGSVPVVSKPSRPRGPGPTFDIRSKNRIVSLDNVRSIIRGEEAPLLFSPLLNANINSYRLIDIEYRWFSTTSSDAAKKGNIFNNRYEKEIKLVGTKARYYPGKLEKTTYFFRQTIFSVNDKNGNKISNFSIKGSLSDKFTISVKGGQITTKKEPHIEYYGNEIRNSDQVVRKGEEPKIISGETPTLKGVNLVLDKTPKYQWLKKEVKSDRYINVTDGINLDGFKLIPNAVSRNYVPEPTDVTTYYYRRTVLYYSHEVYEGWIPRTEHGFVKSHSNMHRMNVVNYPKIILSPTIISAINPSFNIETDFNKSRLVVIKFGIIEVFRGIIKKGNRTTYISTNNIDLTPHYFGSLPSHYKIYVDDILSDTGRVFSTD